MRFLRGPGGANLLALTQPAHAVVCAKGVYRAGCAGPNGAAVVRRPYGYHGGAAVVRGPNTFAASNHGSRLPAMPRRELQVDAGQYTHQRAPHPHQKRKSPAVAAGLRFSK